TTKPPGRGVGSVVALTAATASSRVRPPTSTPPTVTPARIRPEEADTRAVAATLIVASSTTARPTTAASRCQPDSPSGRFQLGSRIPGSFIYLVPFPERPSSPEEMVPGRQDELTDTLGQNRRLDLPQPEASRHRARSLVPDGTRF